MLMSVRNFTDNNLKQKKYESFRWYENIRCVFLVRPVDMKMAEFTEYPHYELWKQLHTSIRLIAHYFKNMEVKQLRKNVRGEV